MINRTRRLLVACLFIAIGVLVSAAHGSDLRPKIDPLARPLIDDGVAVGFMVGIVKDGETQILSYGEISKGSGVAPNADTIYEIGSISKVFTCTLLADMVERGIVKLDDPLQKYLPAEVKAPVADGEPITLEHLATHTSGLPRLPDNMKPADLSNPYADYTVEQMQEFLMGHKLRRSPGKFEYSNYAMGLLGHVLSKRMKKSYEQLLIQQICEPLGMRDTCITLNQDQLDRFAKPYSFNGALKLEKPWDLPTLAGAGAIRSTCNDMLKFIQANLADDDQPISLALRRSHQKRRATNGGNAIGLGWQIARDGITRWHTGMTGGFSSWVAVVPSRDLGVVVLANTANGQIPKFGEHVTRIAFGQEVKPPKKRTAIEVSPAVLKSYVGVYSLTPQFSLTITLEDGKLMAQATGQGKNQIFAESKAKFFFKVVDAQISFVLDEDGQVDHLILHQGGLNQKAARKK